MNGNKIIGNGVSINQVDFFSETSAFARSLVRVIHTLLFQVQILFLPSLPFHLLSSVPRDGNIFFLNVSKHYYIEQS